MQKYRQWCAVTHRHEMEPHDLGRWYRVGDADARIEELQEALRTYGGHKEECAKLTPDDNCECDCGLSSLMER